MTLNELLLIGAVICFGLATCGVSGKRVSVLPLGLGLWALTHLLR